jgi:hypothetical protein
MRLHAVPQPANFITKAISGFSIPMNVVIFQLIKIFLSQGVAITGYRKRPKPPFQKILPSPAPVVVQYSTVSQLKSCVGLLHACMHNAYPIPPYRHRASPDSRENSIAATLHRHRHAAYMTLQCIYINQPLPSIHYLSINAQPQPQRTQIPSFSRSLVYSIFAYTSCNGMPDGLHTLRLGGARCRKAAFRLSAE